MKDENNTNDYFSGGVSLNQEDLSGCNSNTPGTWTITGDVEGGDDNTPTDPVDPTDPTDPVTPGTEQQAENEGVDCDKEISCVGNPINVATGNKYQIETDFTGGAHTGITLTRYYNSQDNTVTQFGANWRSTWDREVVKIDDTTVHVIRENGRTYIFKQNGSGWSSKPGVTFALSGSAASGWTVVDNDDNTESYSGAGSLQSVKARNGELTQLQYGGDGKLASVRGPYGHALIFHHDASGFVDCVTLPGGKQIKYQVDGNKNLAQLAYANGATQKYIYNESSYTSGANLPHALTGIVDGNGARFATYRYNANNQATATEHAGGVEKFQVGYNADGSRTVTDALGNQRGYSFDTVNDIVMPSAISGVPTNPAESMKTTYDANGFVASKTDFEGNVTTYQHSPRGQELSRTEAVGTPYERTFTTVWHPKFNLPTQFTEPSGVPGVNRVTTWTYNDANGAMLSMTIAAEGKSRSWTFSDHDQYGHPGKVTGPLGDVTIIKYNSGAVASITNAMGHASSFMQDSAGRPASSCDPNGLCVTKTYTDFGAVDTSSVSLQVTKYGYNLARILDGVTTPDGAHYTLENDNAHRLAGMIDPLGNHKVFGLDASSNVKTEQTFDPAGTLVRSRGHNYDAVNRLVQDIGAKGQATTYGRNNNGDIIGVTDADDNVTTYARDALRRVHTITAPDGGVTVIDYNPDDSIAVITDPKGNQTIYTYDGLGNQSEEDSPDRGKITRTFDAAGNVATETDGRGLTTTYIRDLLGRVRLAQYGDGTSTKFTYDTSTTNSGQKGRLTLVENAAGSVKMDFDKYGHIILKQQNVGDVTLATRNSFDEQTGHLKNTTLPSGLYVEYGYNQQTGKAETIKVNGKQMIGGIEYEPFSDAPKLWSQGDGSVNLYHERTRDQDGNIEKIVFGDLDASGGWGGQRILYSYDAASRVVCEENNDGQCLRYGYDANSRLTKVDSQVPGINSETYGYDANGNRKEAHGGAYGDRTFDVDPFSNQLKGVNGQARSYDAGGNLQSDGKLTYTFGADGKLAKVSGAGVEVQNTYNGLGERVKKTSGGAAKYFAQVGAMVTGEYTGMGAGTGNAVAEQETVFLAGMPVIVMTPGGNLVANSGRLGEARTIVGLDGHRKAEWQHAPFGDTLPVESGLSLNLRFPGQYADKETGLSYNNNRFYDRNIGAYIGPDPIGLNGGMNPYAYVDGDPGNNVDPWGLDVNELPPDLNATGPHTTFNRNNAGDINKYTSWEENPYTGDWRRTFRFRADGKNHGGVKPPISYDPVKPGSHQLFGRPAKMSEIPTGPRQCPSAQSQLPVNNQYDLPFSQPLRNLSKAAPWVAFFTTLLAPRPAY